MFRCFTILFRCTQLVLDKMGGLIVQTEPRLSQAWAEDEEVNKVRTETTWKSTNSHV